MPGPLSCLLLTAFSASVVEGAVGADGEVAAGRAPVALTGPEESALTFTVTPGVALRLRGASDTLALSYTPRIFYRLPNELDLNRPLVLHQVALTEQSEIGRRVNWASAAQLSIGELDYTASGAVFGQSTPAGAAPGAPAGAPASSVLRTSVADILRAEGQTGLKIDLSRRLSMSLDVSGEYTTPLGENTAVPIDTGAPVPPGEPPPELTVVGPAVPESAQISTAAGFSYDVSRYDHLGAAAEVTYQWFPDTGIYLSLNPEVSWQTQLSQRTTFDVSAGFAYVITLEANPGFDDDNSIGGTGSFNLSSVAHKSRNVRVSTSVGASLDWYFDPLAGTSQPRAGVDVGTNIEIGRDWFINPNAAFYATIREGREAVMGTDAEGNPVGIAVYPDATMLRAELPFSYNLSRAMSLSFGGRATLRGRALTDEGFSMTEQYEFWAFLGLTVRFATGHEDPSWLGL